MTRSATQPSQTVGMGQTSSQIHHPPLPDFDLAGQPKSNEKKRKSKKSKRKSADVEQSGNPEEESANVLLQMRGVDVSNGANPYNDDVAASQQLVAESSPMHPSSPFNVQETGMRSSKMCASQRNGGIHGKRKRGGSAIFEYPSSEEHMEEPQFSKATSTPFDQPSPQKMSPYRSNHSQAVSALDDVPTDEETAVFDEAFGNGSVAPEPITPMHDLYSFSQQPHEISEQQDEMFPPYQLPTHVYTSPKAAQKLKKQKRKPPLATDDAIEEQPAISNEAGQYMLDCDLEDFDNLFQVDLSLADPFHFYEGNDMPIDPELHSMSALPPAVDLSALDNGDGNVRGGKKRKPNKNSSSQSNKRRRLSEIKTTNIGRKLYISPYTFQDGQENNYDRVSPVLGDYLREPSPELGTPFTQNATHASRDNFENASRYAQTSQAEKTPQRMNRGGKRGSAGTAASEREDRERGYQSERSLRDVSEKGGAFTPAEIAKLDAFRDKYCDANNMNYHYFNSRIQTSMRGNPPVTNLYNEIHEILPYRSRLSVQKFVRRRYHNYAARGTWTAEEDNALRRAVEEKGKQWKVVGEMIDRMPNDCRDRYRNYLVNSEHRNREQWTEEEVRNLCAAILECMELLKEERKRANDEKYGPGFQQDEEGSDQEVEDIKGINWQAVSDRMGEHGGGRSRLQCSFKWGQIKKNDQNDLMDMVREARGLKIKRSGPTKNPWRQRLAMRRVANMKKGDQYTLLRSILKSKAPTEGNIPWKSLGDDDFRAIWTASDRKSAWRKLKENIPASETMHYLEVVNQLITQLLAEGSHDLEERWDPEVHGDVSQTKPKKSKKAKGKEKEGADTDPEREQSSRRSKRERKQARSKQFVEHDEDEDDADEEAQDNIDQPRSHNSYHPLQTPMKVNGHTDKTDEDASEHTDDGVQDGGEQANDVDYDPLFDGSDDEDIYAPPRSGTISPELAGRVEGLQYE